MRLSSCPKKREHIKEELWFVKQCHVEVIQFCLTVQELNQGDLVNLCSTKNLGKPVIVLFIYLTSLLFLVLFWRFSTCLNLLHTSFLCYLLPLIECITLIQLTWSFLTYLMHNNLHVSLSLTQFTACYPHASVPACPAQQTARLSL